MEEGEVREGPQARKGRHSEGLRASERKEGQGVREARFPP